MINQENKMLVFGIYTGIKNLPEWFDTIGKICNNLALCKGCYNSIERGSDYCDPCYQSIMEELK